MSDNHHAWPQKTSDKKSTNSKSSKQRKRKIIVTTRNEDIRRTKKKNPIFMIAHLISKTFVRKQQTKRSGQKGLLRWSSQLISDDQNEASCHN